MQQGKINFTISTKGRVKRYLSLRMLDVEVGQILKEQPQQWTAPKDTEIIDFTPIRPQPPLLNQQNKKDKRQKYAKIVRFVTVLLHS